MDSEALTSVNSLVAIGKTWLAAPIAVIHIIKPAWKNVRHSPFGTVFAASGSFIDSDFEE